VVLLRAFYASGQTGLVTAEHVEGPLIYCLVQSVKRGSLLITYRAVTCG